MIITRSTCERARQLSIRCAVYDVRGQMSAAASAVALARTYRESRLLIAAGRYIPVPNGSVSQSSPPGWVRPLRPHTPVLRSRGSPVDPTPYNDRASLAGRHLLYGSSATSNQRLIIQRGNCATSVYDRATRHARPATMQFLPRMFAVAGPRAGAQIDAVDRMSIGRHTP